MKQDNFNLFFQLTKVDEAKRLVYGRATQEVPDGVREIMDYDTSRPFFDKWSNAAKKRSGGKSMGNMREMHSPVAAGKVIDIQFNDAEKAIDIGTYVSDDNTWKKIMDGVLTGFSVGGKYEKRWPDGSYTRYTANPNEISYVDAPAVPTALYSFIKADGSQEMRKLGTNMKLNSFPLNVPGDNNNEIIPNPEDDDDASSLNIVHDASVISEIPGVAGFLSPSVSASADKLEVRPAGVIPASDLNAGFTKEINKLVTAVEALVNIKKLEIEKQERTLAELKKRGSNVGIPRREGEPLIPQPGFSTNPEDYADPANWAKPIDTPARIQAEIADFNKGKGKEQYDARQWNILGRRIAQKASSLLYAKYQYSPESKVIKKEKTMAKNWENMSKADLDQLLSDVKAAAGNAVENISNPQNAMNALNQIVAALDVATDVSPASLSASPQPPTGEQEGVSTDTLKATGVSSPSSSPSMSPAQPSSSSIGTAPSTKTATVVPSASTPSAPSVPTATKTEGVSYQPDTTATPSVSSPSSPSSPSTSVPSSALFDTLMQMVKDQGDQLKTLSETIKNLQSAPSAAPVAKANDSTLIPVGDVNSIVKKGEESDAVLKALTDGGPYALQKAIKAANVDGSSLSMNEIYEKANVAVVDSLKHAGLFGHRILDFNTEPTNS